ncbi:MAG TPA: xanthine dehydrogenase family protein molybdopterin-binding subunit [bacterium]|nr:xanthine dehydrogenase family protein molybdopterin-binding subunit [bacterium]
MSEATTRWVGRAVRRREDPRFLRGQARYVDDLVLPQMAYLAVVRSAAAHARLGKVDVRAAAQGLGVLTVVVGADLAGSLSPVPPNAVEGAHVAPVPHPVLAQGRVRYVGEPVAAVLAETRAAAEDAASHIDIEYDVLPAITDPRQAQSAPALHDAAPGNVLLRWQRSSGDVEGAFASASRIVAQRFHIPRLAAAPIEPRGAVASYDPGTDRLTVWCSAQDPHRPLAQLSHALRRPDDRIRVIVPDVGGAFGSKGAVPAEVILAAWLAMRVGRPVKWVEDRRENLAASYQGRGIDAEVEIALDAGGTIRALRTRLIADLGAYLFPSTPVVPVTTAMLMTGTYAIPAAAVDLVGVATNKVPTGPYRGAGRPEAAYLVERVVDLAAHEFGVDPVAMRRRNLVPADRFPYRTPLGFTYDSGNYARTLETACTLVEYDRWRREQSAARQNGRLLGIGVAMYVERAGSAVWESAAVSITPAGHAIVRIGSTPTGQGHVTTFSQIVVDALGMDFDAVTIEQGDSAVVPRGVGTFGSRSITIGGSALVSALEQIKAKAGLIAAHLLEAGGQDVVWTDGRLHVRGAPQRGVALAQVAAAAYQPSRLPLGLAVGLEAYNVFQLPGPVFPFGTYAAVVEVDPLTGEVTIHKLVAVDDAGRIVNPLLAEGQVIGAAAQGLGQACLEEVVYGEDGQLLTTTFADYALARAPQVPPLTTTFLETLSPLNPLGVKGVGEAGAIATPSALANAVLDALAPLGIRHLDFPLTPRRIWDAIATATASSVTRT